MRIKQLTLKERYHIWASLKQGKKQKEIAESIGVHPSTICREIQGTSSKKTQRRLVARADRAGRMNRDKGFHCIP